MAFRGTVSLGSEIGLIPKTLGKDRKGKEMFSETVLDAARKEIDRINARIDALNKERDSQPSEQTAWQLRAEMESLSERKGDVETIQRIALNLE